MASADDSDTNADCDPNCQAHRKVVAANNAVTSEQGSSAVNANANAQGANILKMAHQAKVKTTTAVALGTAQMGLNFGEQTTKQDPTTLVLDDALSPA